MVEYFKRKEIKDIPRLPLEGNLDLTYRCNNNCRHCWVSIPAGSPEKDNELTFDEIIRIVNEARGMGCHRWSISGGEPMLRPDFAEIFDYITAKSVSYTLNTNGTLITPKIARLMTRKGSKMVALYGATAEVHDHLTRHPGSFEAVMRGFAYLKEQGTGFIVQLIPMKDNFHQFKEMIKLAETLSRHWRTGAPWLYLRADGDVEKNREILRQRLKPKEVVELDKPDIYYEEWMEREGDKSCHMKENEHLFASCIAKRRDFHVDPYGQMAFCCFIKDSTLRCDLRKGSFKESWEEFIPSSANKVKATKEYQDNCGSCEFRKDCRWCPVYGYLEHRRFSATVEYLCSVAREKRNYKKEEWKKNHRRYYQIAGITIQVDSDLPITEATFQSKFKVFEVEGPGEDTITIQHYFSLPDLDGRDLGKEVYHKHPWAIYRKGNAWIYLGISLNPEDREINKVAVFNNDHTRARIYHEGEKTFRQGDLQSLTLLPTDQILLARVLADREGCYLHASGVNLDSQGLLFVGHSEAGKSTLVKMLQDRAEILCDDRMIVRRRPEGFRIYGTWTHGEVADVSATSAPLSAILFLEQAQKNCLIPLGDRQEIIRKLLACLIKPFVTAEWWDQMLSLLEKMAREVPCYSLHFDKSGQVVDLLKHL